MAKRVVALVLCAALFVPLCACASFINGEYSSERVHSPAITEKVEVGKAVEVSNYVELEAAVIGFVENRIENGLIHIYDYSGDVIRDVEKVCTFVAYNTPMGAFAVYYISTSVNRIVSYYEATVTITYKKTQAQMDSLTYVGSSNGIRSRLLLAITGFESYVAMEVPAADITEANVLDHIRSVYYSYPSSMAVFPNVEINIYPDAGRQRIVEVLFSYIYTTSAMNLMVKEVGNEAERLISDYRTATGAEAIVNIAQTIVDHVIFIGDAGANEEHHGDAIAYSTYGALVMREANSEGLAMAFKLLCDMMNVNCSVVVGKYNGSYHVWNIVEYDGKYYHFDLSMVGERGLEGAIMLTDQDIRSEYWWHIEDYNACVGSKTFWDLINAAALPE